VNPLTIFAKRFIAGERTEDALEAVSALNGAGLCATLDILGENVRNEEEATRAADEYIGLLDRIAASGVDSNVSLKLTMMGLDISDEFCYENVRRVVEKARERENFVRIDMEGSAYTQRTLDLFRRLRADYENVGIVIQACLKRSEQDIRDLNADGHRVRLCKGAYKEPADIAFVRKEDTNANYIALMKLLLRNGTHPAIATHDRAMIDATIAFVDELGLTENRFEFQMLYGIGRKLQRELVGRGFTMRVYVPYGRHWLPYYVRRLRERKENIFFVLKHLIGD
jgi:proline dehydrogenase